MRLKHGYTIASPQEAADYLSNYKLFDNDNWFYGHRFMIVSRFLPPPCKNVELNTKPTLFDFGCGSGIYLRWLLKYNYRLSLTGYDPYLLKNINSEDRRIHFITELTSDYDKTFDYVTALDVIEHIEDEAGALATICRLLKPNGRLLLTVPAYEFLYSLHDAAVGHYRRYDKKSIAISLKNAGFAVTHCEYFLSFLIPAAAFIKYYLPLKKMLGGKIQINELPSNLLGLLPMLAKAERLLMRLNYRLPCGSFMFVCAKKQTCEQAHACDTHPHRCSEKVL